MILKVKIMGCLNEMSKVSTEPSICHHNSFVKLNPPDFQIIHVRNYSVSSVITSALASFVDLPFIQCKR